MAQMFAISASPTPLTIAVRNWVTLMYFNTIFLYDQDLSEIPLVESRQPCTLTKASAGDMRPFKQIRSMRSEKVEQFTRRFERGDRCYLAALDGKFVHYSWVQTQGKHPISGVKLHTIRPGEIWIFDCRTADWARGRHIYPYVLTTILQEFKQAGNYHTAWIYTSDTNIASQKGIQRAGFTLRRKLKAIHLANRAISLPTRPW